MAENPKATLIAGATEIGVDVTKKFKPFPFLVSTDAVPELTRITKTRGPLEDRGVGDAHRGRGYRRRRVSLARQDDQGLRREADPEPGHARREPGDGLADRRQRRRVLLSLDAQLVLASASVRADRGPCRFLHRVPEDPSGAGRDHPGDPAAASRARGGAHAPRRTSSRFRSAASSTSASWRPPSRSTPMATGVVRRARIGYGGVAATPVRARRAEAALEGRTIAEAAADVSRILGEEFKPIDDVRAGAEFRRGLIVSLWEKFVAGDSSIAQDAPLDFEKGAEPPPSDPSRALRHESSVGHVTGRAMYADDTAQRRLDARHLARVRSPCPGPDQEAGPLGRPGHARRRGRAHGRGHPGPQPGGHRP